MVDSSLLQCLQCGGALRKLGGAVVCKKCEHLYQMDGETIIFRKPAPDRLRVISSLNQRDSIILWIKSQVKKNPFLFDILNLWSGAFIGLSAKKVVSGFKEGQVVLNLGSGVKKVGPGVINVDYDKFPGVAVVADVCSLPFKNNSIDVIIAESLLEHLPQPEVAVAEVCRVLKPRGVFYVVTPFMLGYHASPRDYYRWTEFGMRELLSSFSVEISGSAWGPTTALTSMLGNWLAIIFSFGHSLLYQIWLAIFIFIFGPITYLDYIVGKHPRATDYSHGLYFVARKNVVT